MIALMLLIACSRGGDPTTPASALQIDGLHVSVNRTETLDPSTWPDVLTWDAPLPIEGLDLKALSISTEQGVGSAGSGKTFTALSMALGHGTRLLQLEVGDLVAARRSVVGEEDVHVDAIEARYRLATSGESGYQFHILTWEACGVGYRLVARTSEWELSALIERVGEVAAACRPGSADSLRSPVRSGTR